MPLNQEKYTPHKIIQIETACRLIEQRIRPYQVPIFTESGISDSGGSGTLFTLGSHKGIVTASHVIAANYRNKIRKIYIPHKPKVEFEDFFEKEEIPYNLVHMDDLHDIENYLPNWRNTWLDIAALLISDEDFNKLLNMGKKAVDLGDSYLQYSRDKEQYASNNHPNRTVAGVIYGHPREGAIFDNNNNYDFKNSGSYIGGFQHIKQSEKLKVSEREFRIVTDLTTIIIDRNIDQIPNNFAGASGGGLWKFILNISESGDYTIEKQILMGIFVCADTDKNGKDTILSSRGPVSLYNIFYPYLSRYNLAQ